MKNKDMNKKTNKQKKKEKIKPVKVISKKTAKFQEDVRKHMATAMGAGFAFVMALVWRDAIQSTIDSFFKRFGIEGTGYIYKIIIAFIITIICVIGLKFVALWSEQNKNPDKK